MAGHGRLENIHNTTKFTKGMNISNESHGLKPVRFAMRQSGGRMSAQKIKIGKN
jgi:hypothetical protein